MANELTFNIYAKQSPSDFGAPVPRKDEKGVVISFGVMHAETGMMVWTNNADWYGAWKDGLVMPESITLKEEQRVTKKMDAETGLPVKENGRQVYVPVPGEKTLVMTGLKTRTQLENEDKARVWNKMRDNKVREMVFEEHRKYNEAAQKAAEVVTLSAEQKTKLDDIMAMYDL